MIPNPLGDLQPPPLRRIVPTPPYRLRPLARRRAPSAGYTTPMHALALRWCRASGFGPAFVAGVARMMTGDCRALGAAEMCAAWGLV